MARYVARRIVYSGAILWAISLLAFLLLSLAPGDFFDEARLNPRASPETIAALRARSGLSGSVPARYAHWVRSAFAGDFGVSIAYNLPAAQLILPRCRNTLVLTTTTLLVTWAFALPLGVWSAARRHHWLDRLLSLFGTSLFAAPDIVLASALLLIAARTRWLPVGGMGEARHLVLPVMALAAGTFPLLFRHVRAAILEAADAPFIEAARAMGIPRTSRLWRHTLPAAANPLISLVGLSAAGLLSSSLVIEVIFGWPGIGPLFLEAIGARDTYVILVTVMLSATVLVAANLFADLLLYAADPRIRVKS